MKKIILGVLLFASVTSCMVPASKFENMTAQRDASLLANDSLQKVIVNRQLDLLTLESKLSQSQKELDKLKEQLAQLKKNATEGAVDLINKLDAKQKEIDEKEKRIAEFKEKLDSRERAVNALKSKMQEALLGFAGKGLSVSVKNGKVYVSLSNQLLFQVGKTDIDVKGQEALLELAKALKAQPDINVLVEGHTDNQPISAGGRYKDNWDLSVMRATEVVRYLTVTGGVPPERVIASGRGEFFPISPGNTPEELANNRRTEIILTPKLDELFEFLK